jgi:vitamin B12 transporter
MNQKSLASRFAFAVCAACATSGAFSQDDLQETIVTATRTPVALDAVDAPVIVITRQDIERSLAGDVSEILQGHAGLEIARNGGPGQTTSLFTRGTDSNHTVVLIDGVRINPGTIGGAALQSIAPESLERIEIVKGPRSTLYGSDAIGGVIQLFTRGAANSGLSAGATYGSLHTQQLFGDAAVVVNDQFRFGVGGSYGASEGMPAFVDDPVDRGYRNTTGRAYAEFDASESLTFRGRAFRATGRTEYTNPTFSDPAYEPVSQDFENSVYSFETDFHGADGLGLRATLSRMNDDIDQNQANFAGRDFAHTRRDNVDLQLDLPEWHAHAISIGAQHSDEDTNARSFGSEFDEGTTVSQGFVQDQFTAGWLNSRLAVGFVDHDSFGSEVTWNAEFGVGIGHGTRIAVLGGKAFRAPDGTDRFGFGGNPQLQPEVSEQYELTVRQKLGERHLLSLSAFDNRIRDLINFVVTDPVTFDGRNENVDRARIRGVELGYRFTGESWRARTELTLQDPRDESSDERLLRRSRESLMLAVDRDVGRLDLGLDIAAYGNRKDVGFPTVTLDSYALVNATVRYRATPQLSVQARLENAFDEDYTLVQGYRTEGRAYTIGVRFNFE